MNISKTGPHARLRVAVVDRFAMVAETVVVAVGRVCAPTPVVVPAGTAAPAVVAAVLATRPDVVVLHLDTYVPCLDFLVGQIADSGAIVVALVERADDGQLGELIEHGAAAAVRGELGLAELVDVICRLTAEEPALDPDELERLRSCARDARGPVASTDLEAVARLSSREGAVLRHLMAGRAPARIARLCYVSEATVRTQVRSILGKLEVQSQLSAVAIAYRAGWRPEATEERHRYTRAG